MFGLVKDVVKGAADVVTGGGADKLLGGLFDMGPAKGLMGMAGSLFGGAKAPGGGGEEAKQLMDDVGNLLVQMLKSYASSAENYHEKSGHHTAAPGA